MSSLLCSFCNEDFTDRGGLTNHVRVNHPSEYRARLGIEIEALNRRIDALNSMPKEEELEDQEDVITSRELLEYSIAVIQLLNEMPPDTFPGGSLVREHMFVAYGSDINEIREDIATMPAFRYTKRQVESFIDGYKHQIETTRERIEKSKIDERQRTAGGYICELCGGAFKSKGSYTGHLHKKHPDEYLAEHEKEMQKHYASLDFYTVEDVKLRIEENISFVKIGVYLLHGRLEDAFDAFEHYIRVQLEMERIGFENYMKADSSKEQFIMKSKEIVARSIENFKLSWARELKIRPIPQIVLDKIEEIGRSF